MSAPITMIEKTLNGSLYQDANGKRYPAVMAGGKVYDFAKIESFEEWLGEVDPELHLALQTVDELQGFTAYTEALISHRDKVMAKIGHRRSYWLPGVDLIRTLPDEIE